MFRIPASAARVSRARTWFVIIATALACIACSSDVSLDDESAGSARSLLGTVPPPPESCGAMQPAAFPDPLATGRTSPSGNIEGAFAVNAFGAATYTVPLRVPQGAGGLEPQLTLQYNSNGADGMLGIGFSLGGLTAITRCPRTVATDGYLDKIHYDKTDAFCMDGKRLVPVQTIGTTVRYRTLPDSMVDVSGVMDGDGDMATFSATTRDGTYMHFGESADSNVSSNRTGSTGMNVPRAWLVNEVTVPNRNASVIAIHYANYQDLNHVTVEYVPDRITYAGRSISFNYVNRPASDQRTVWLDGMRLRSTLLLQSISESAPNGSAIRNYNLAYALSQNSQRSVLQSITECAGSVCQPETDFAWFAAANAQKMKFQETATPLLTPTTTHSALLTMDITGDGLPDVVSTDLPRDGETGVTQWTTMNNLGGAGWSSPAATWDQPMVQNISGPDANLEVGASIDYNQDGLEDLFLYDVEGSFPTWRVMQSRVASSGAVTFESVDTQIPRPFSGTAPSHLVSPYASVHLADTDGDGATDLVECTNPSNVPGLAAWTLYPWKPTVGTGGGFDTNGTPIDVLATVPCDVDTYVIDVDGDGRIDLLTPIILDEQDGQPLFGSTYTAATLTQAGWSSVDTRLKRPLPGQHLVFVDLDGNGLVDAVEDGWDPVNLTVSMNQGGTFGAQFGGFVPEPTQAPGTTLAFAAPIDANGDGRQDLLLPIAQPGQAPAWMVLKANSQIDAADGAFTIVDSNIPADVTISQGADPGIANAHAPRIADVDGDGDADVLLFAGGTLHVYSNTLSNEDRLSSVTDGMNAHRPGDALLVPNVSITYDHLVDRAITQGISETSVAADALPYLAHRDQSDSCTFPRRCVVGNATIVRSYSVNNGYDVPLPFNVSYRDGRYDHSGPGFAGFGARVVVDQVTGQGNLDTYDNSTVYSGTYPLAGVSTQHLTWSPAFFTESNTSRVYLESDQLLYALQSTSGPLAFFPKMTQRTRSRWEGNYSAGEAPSIQQWAENAIFNDWATQLADTYEFFQYDAYGNNTSHTLNTLGMDRVEWVTRTFDNDGLNWVLGEMRTEDVCSSTGGVQQCRSRALTYYPNASVHTEHISNTGGGNTSTDQTYDYDQYGNLNHETESISTGEARTTCVAWDSYGVHPISSVNPLGQPTFYQFDDGLDVPLASMDPNGYTTQWQYDAEGRRILELRPDTTSTATNYVRNHNATLGYYLTVENVTGGGQDETVQLDELGRENARYWFGPQPTCPSCAPLPRVMVTTQYDMTGKHVAKVSRPSAEGTDPSMLLYETWSYDAIDRPILHTQPWTGATTSTTYVQNKATINEPGGVTRTIQADALLRPTSVTDPAGSITYGYGPFDAISNVVAPGNVTTTIQHDAYGHVLSHANPDHGTTTGIYDGFGQLVSQSDADGRSSTMKYDKLGRATEKDDVDGVKRWNWDTAANGIGMIASTTIAPTATSPVTASTSYTYSSRGHVTSEILGVSGEAFTVSFVYDSFRRIGRITYPTASGIASFAVHNTYDDFGHIIEVDDYASGIPYWTLLGVDSAGRETYEKFGNGVTTFRAYDNARENLSTLTTQLGASYLQRLTYTWDVRRNLFSRADAIQTQTEYFGYDQADRLKCASFNSALTNCSVSVSYDGTGNIQQKSDVGTFVYRTDKPHAVATAGTNAYDYDGVGNQKTRPDAALTFNASDLPRTITALPSGAQTTYDYDASDDKVRVRAPGVTTIFMGDYYERETSASGVKHRFKVANGERVFYLETRQSGQGTIQDYLHTDYLGSPEVLTNGSGVVSEKRSYDAFGQRRNPIWGQPYTPPASTPLIEGYTSQDDEGFGLIDMKGRTYDPKLGRFLQTDPEVAAPNLSQSWNPYAYALHNPLRYIDPTGFDEDDPANVVAGDRIASGGAKITGGITYMPQATIVSRGRGLELVPDSRPPADQSTAKAPEEAPHSGGEEVPADVTSVGPRKRDDVPRPPRNTDNLDYEHLKCLKRFDWLPGHPPPTDEEIIARIIDDSHQQDVQRALEKEARDINNRGHMDGLNQVIDAWQAIEFVKGISSLLRFGAEGLGSLLGRDPEVIEELGADAEAAAASKTNCFVAGTPIATADGEAPIESLRVGDLVWSENESTGEIELRPVLQRFVTPDRKILDVEVMDDAGRDELIRTTPGHRFWVDGVGWTFAGDLRQGDVLVTRSGGHALFERAEPEKELQTVYNLEVASTHTYFVGTEELWVHNQNCGGPHGNSASSQRPQHVYEIKRTEVATSDKQLHKYGISGGPKNGSGLSARAETQVRALNRAAGGQYSYQSSIVEDIPGGPGARGAALSSERKLVYDYKNATGAKPPGNKRP